MGDEFITLQNLSIGYDCSPVLSDISLSIERGSFTAILTVTGSNGQASSAGQTITVTNAPPTANADFSISASPSSSTAKAGQNAYYTVTVTPTGGYNGSIILNVSRLPLGAVEQ